jgi:hypothetical protein
MEDFSAAGIAVKQRYEAHRTEVATRLLIAAVQDNMQNLVPRQIVQVCVALADELLAELLNPTPRHRQ